MEGFKYQITVKALLRKGKEIGDIDYTPVYFNSANKTLINFDNYDLDKSFQEILYRINNWINERSGWMIESINGEYVNISIYSPLIGSTYTELPDKLKNPMKGQTNIKNSDNKCFLWCHIRHLNLVKRHSEGITKVDKKMVDDLDYEGIKFHLSKKDYCSIERQNNICINIFCYGKSLTYPIYVSYQKFHNSIDLLLTSDGNKSHYVLRQKHLCYTCYV